VAEALHQILERGAGRRRQGLASVPHVVEGVMSHFIVTLLVTVTPSGVDSWWERGSR
jgi:hypothetical protein